MTDHIEYDLPWMEFDCSDMINTMDMKRVLPEDMTEEEHDRVLNILDEDTLEYILDGIIDTIKDYLYEIYIPENFRYDYKYVLHAAMERKLIAEDDYKFLMDLMKR